MQALRAITRKAQSIIAGNSNTVPTTHTVVQSEKKKPPGYPQEYNVVVTGFSIWGEGTPWPPPPVNTSWEIANAMPRVIFREGKPNVRIIKYPDAVRTSWETVRKLIPPLWDGKKNFYRLWEEEGEADSFRIDALLHIGMLDKPNEAFRIERNGYKSGYDLPDVDGKYPNDRDKTGDGMWEHVPEKLSTDTDLDAIYKQVCEELDDVPIMIAEDHPRFLCGYIYYSSLARCYNEGEKRRLLFLHVPIEYESKNIQTGVRVASATISAMVDDLASQTE